MFPDTHLSSIFDTVLVFPYSVSVFNTVFCGSVQTLNPVAFLTQLSVFTSTHSTQQCFWHSFLCFYPDTQPCSVSDIVFCGSVHTLNPVVFYFRYSFLCFHSDTQPSSVSDTLYCDSIQSLDYVVFLSIFSVAKVTLQPSMSVSPSVSLQNPKTA